MNIKKRQQIWLLFLFSVCCNNIFAQLKKTDILILGSDHLQQVYQKDNINTDVLTARNQQSIHAFADEVIAYKADAVMIEVLPEHQKEVDSLYHLYLSGKLKIPALDDGRSEVYQLAFYIAKTSSVDKIYCVNAPGGTSQSMLDNGDNIELYKAQMQELRKVVTEKYEQLAAGNLSFKDYLTFLNKPETYNLVYKLRYYTPLRVTNGTFKNPDETVDTSFINKKYIGAELTSIFKNRDYKIYSNIVTTQIKTKAARILLIIGAAHIGSLKNIFKDDDEFNLVNADEFLK